MDSWPTDDRQPDTQRKARDKGKEKDINKNYPHFQPGLLSAITLYENNGRLEWTSLVNNHPKEKLVAKGKSVNVFPATLPPPLPAPPTTILQRAEQGAHFLRTYFPDVDITAELVRDEITADATISRNLEAFDPYMGSLLETICCCLGPSKQAAFLAFPMGSLNRDLNLSPFVYSKKNHTTFKPLGISSQTFATPIQQIISSNPSAGSGQSSHLAVRTFGSTSFFEIEAATSSTSSPSARFINIATVVSSDVGNRPLVDLKFSSPESGVVLANDYGAVYECSFVEGRKIFQLAYASSPVAPKDFFWRIARSERDRGCILASHKHVQQLDFRTNNSSLALLSLQRPGELVTSIETYQGDHLMRLATTSEILWIDERFPRKPLLGCKHGRQFDRYLDVKTVFLQTPLTFLTSRRNGLVTVYDVCRSDDNLLHINAQPYSPQAILGSHTSRMGYTYFRHPSDPSESDISLFTLSERGSIHCLNLEIPTGDEQTSDRLIFEWSEDVKELNVRAKDLRSDFGPLDAQDGPQVDLRPAYDKLFHVNAEDSDSEAESGPETVYETLERLPFFWQESTGSLEHMVTLFDIAFRSGEEPSHASRADFLTQCALNSTSGYRALVQGRVLSAPLIKQSLWHHRISPILKHFDTDFSEDTQVTVDRLRRYDLASHPDRTEQSLRRESEAREQLALDLGLSIDVFSPQPVSKPAVDILENMSRATEALSLADEPPQIHFGYLRPTPKGRVNHYAIPNPESSGASEDELTSPMGVRLLLKEWEIGTDPHEFIYKDPYDDSVPDSLPSRRTKLHTRETGSVGARNPLVARSQRPPLVVAASSSIAPPTIQGKASGRGARSRTPGVSGPSGESQPGGACSQGFTTNTQILPGPYGGRPGVAFGKKKHVKKRLDGF